MFRVQENKKLNNILTVIALVGEMPLAAASQLGSHEAYRKMLYELEKKQVYENTQDKRQMCVKLINMSDKGKLRRCRLFKKAIPILDWLGLKKYYEETFPNNRVSGGGQNRFRNDMIAEAVMMMLEANIEVAPTRLPTLRLNNRYNSFNGRSCFYTTKQIKKTLNKGINKIISSRIVGVLFAGNNVYAVYNTRSSNIKWKGMNEMKTKYVVGDLALVNGDISKCESAIIFGKDDKTILESFFNSTEFHNKDFRFDKIYNNVYAIPQNQEGLELLKLFKVKDFQEKILDGLFDKNNRCKNSGYGWHAEVNGEYAYSYLDANIAGLTRFWETARRGKGKNKFMVVCYDFQKDFIKEYFDGIARVAVIPFQKIKIFLTGGLL